MTAGYLRPVAVTLLLGLASPAAAQTSDELAATVRRQQEIIEALSRRVEQLEARHASTTPAPAAPAAAHVAQPARVAAAPAPFTAKVRGRIHADAWGVEDGASGTELRRARIGLEGKVASLPYVIETDLAGDRVTLQDAFVAVPITAGVQARLGYHKVPFGLDDQTSDNYNLFLEHPAGIDPFTPGRGVAASLWAQGRNWFATAGLFGEAENDSRDGLSDENLTVAARLAWAPVREENRYLHFAVAGYRTRLQGPPTLRLRARPERHLAPFALDAGVVAADSALGLGFEAAASVGPFGAAAEAAQMQVRTRASDLHYGGYAVEAWWTLTGEFRPYKMDGAVFDRLRVARPLSQGGWGAWQIAARFSHLDLNDSALNGGRLSVGSLGVNWYLEDRARLMLDLNRSEASQPAGEVRQTGLGARVQVDF